MMLNVGALPKNLPNHWFGTCSRSLGLGLILARPDQLRPSSPGQAWVGSGCLEGAGCPGPPVGGSVLYPAMNLAQSGASSGPGPEPTPEHTGSSPAAAGGSERDTGLPPLSPCSLWTHGVDGDAPAGAGSGQMESRASLFGKGPGNDEEARHPVFVFTVGKHLHHDPERTWGREAVGTVASILLLAPAQ